MFLFFLGVAMTAFLHEGLKRFNKYLDNSDEHYLQRPMLEDVSFKAFLSGVNKIKYAKDCKGQQDEMRFRLVQGSLLLRKYRLTATQAEKLGDVFGTIQTYEKYLAYVRYPLLLTDHTMNTEMLAIEESTAKLLAE